MKKLIIALALAASTSSLFAQTAPAQADPVELACAVMPAHKVNIEAAVKSKMFADFKGRRYFFCCAGCPAQFKADPAKFASAPSIPVPVQKAPTELACAIMPAHKVNIAAATKSKMFADYKGRRYFFCCAGCPAQFKADPAKFATAPSIPTPVTKKKKG